MSTSKEGKGSWVFGLIILVVGIMFIIENFTDLKMWERVWDLWPVILLIWGIKEIWQNKSLFFGVILIAIGAIFLAKYFLNFEVSESVWKFWPVLIITLGIDQIFKSFGGFRAKAKKKEKEEEV